MFYRIYKLTMMQLGEKLDLGKLRDKKGLIKTIAQKVMGLILLSMVIFVLLFVIKHMLFIKIDKSFFIMVLIRPFLSRSLPRSSFSPNCIIVSL